MGGEKQGAPFGDDTCKTQHPPQLFVQRSNARALSRTAKSICGSVLMGHFTSHVTVMTTEAPAVTVAWLAWQ
jgi:hypothetical protein